MNKVDVSADQTNRRIIGQVNPSTVIWKAQIQGPEGIIETLQKH